MKGGVALNDTIPMKDVERFWNKVDKSGNCWLWTACTNKYGYGIFQYQHRGYQASRFVWMIVNGEIPAGMFVCHTCDNPKCVKPNHLFLGTPKDNAQDMFRKKRNIVAGRRLSEDAVREIRNLHATTNMTQAQIAARFGVRQTQVSHIVNRKQWKDL